MMDLIKRLLSKKRSKQTKIPPPELPPLAPIEHLFYLGCRHGYIDAMMVVTQALDEGEDPLEALARRSKDVMEETVKTSHRCMADAVQQHHGC